MRTPILDEEAEPDDDDEEVIYTTNFPDQLDDALASSSSSHPLSLTAPEHLSFPNSNTIYT